MQDTVILPHAIDLLPGSFVLSLEITRDSTIIPDVTSLEVYPHNDEKIVAETLAGPIPLSAWRIFANPELDQETLSALIIPNEPGTPWPACDAVYRRGCMFFDGRSLAYFEAKTSLAELADYLIDRWRQKLGLPEFGGMPPEPQLWSVPQRRHFWEPLYQGGY